LPCETNTAFFQQVVYKVNNSWGREAGMLIEFLDHLFRFGAIVNIVWVMILLSLYSPEGIHRPISIVLSICTISYLSVIAYDEDALFGPILGAVLEFNARLTLVLIWLFCLSLFKDNFKMKPMYYFVLGLYVMRALWFQMAGMTDDNFQHASVVLRTIIYLYLLYIILSDYSGDLLEKRRILRLWIIATLVIVPFMITLERAYFGGTVYLDRMSLIESLPAFFTVSILLFELMKIIAREFFISTDTSRQGQTPDAATLENKPEGEDAYNLALLEEKMRNGLYCEPNLTVSKLAEVINIPEHRLRRLINHYLGHQNISQYLNGYRIEEAKKRLADADLRHVSILEIAMDIGYVSLRPFNRAFKNRTDQTPSSYRQSCLLKSSALANSMPSV
jgi:AraC-like DNA-binding protein